MYAEKNINAYLMYYENFIHLNSIQYFFTYVIVLHPPLLFPHSSYFILFYLTQLSSSDFLSTLIRIQLSISSHIHLLIFSRIFFYIPRDQFFFAMLIPSTV